MKEHTRTHSVRPRRIVRWGVPALALGVLALDAAAQESRPIQDERPIGEARPDRARTQDTGISASGGALAAELQRINSDFRARVTQYFQSLDPQKATGVNPSQLLITSVDSSTVVAGIAADEALINRGRGETPGARGAGADLPERELPGNVTPGRPDLDGAAGAREGRLLGFLFVSGPGLRTRSLGDGISAREFESPGSAAGNLAPGQSLPTGFYDVRTGPGMRNLQLVDERGQVVTTIPFGGMADARDRGAARAARDDFDRGRADDDDEGDDDDDARAAAREAGAPRGDLGRPDDVGMPGATPDWAAVYATILRELAPDFGLSRG